MACRVCLGDHLMDECDKSTCFKCAGIGHRVRECSFRDDNQRCYKCRKNGHKVKDCSVITLINFDEKENEFSVKRSMKKMVCANCFEIGHISCNKNL